MSFNTKLNELWKWFREALEHMRKGDAVQASEKLYKVAEDCVKILAELNRVPGYEAKLLDKVVKSLRSIYGEEILDAWTAAYRLHQRGFREEMLTVEDVAEEAHKIESMPKLVDEEVKRLSV